MSVEFEEEDEDGDVEKSKKGECAHGFTAWHYCTRCAVNRAHAYESEKQAHAATRRKLDELKKQVRKLLRELREAKKR